MKRRYQVTGEVTYSEKCDCEFCEGHTTHADVDDTFEVVLPFGADPDSADPGTRGIVTLAAEDELQRRGYDYAEFKEPPQIEDLGEVSVEDTLRALHAPMLPGFRGL